MNKGIITQVIGAVVDVKFEAGEFDVCTIFYNQFKNVITQIPQAQQIIPLNNVEDKNSSDESYENGGSSKAEKSSRKCRERKALFYKNE